MQIIPVQPVRLPTQCAPDSRVEATHCKDPIIRKKRRKGRENHLQNRTARPALAIMEVIKMGLWHVER